jgi:hypothetical protein
MKNDNHVPPIALILHLTIIKEICTEMFNYPFYSSEQVVVITFKRLELAGFGAILR